jgi:predicted dehydrogenase
MSSEKVRFAVLGMGGQNSHYADTLFRNPRVEIVAVTDENPEPADRQKGVDAAEKFGVPYIEDVDEVLGSSDVDAMSFSSPFDRRAPLVEKMASAGKHIFGDKPLTDNLADADSIIESVARHGIKLMVGHNYRFNPAILQAREALQNGDVGLPWAIHSEWIIAAGKKVAGVGELRNHGMYPLDALLYLVPNRPLSVYAVTGSFFFEEARTIGLEDLAFITMNLEHGVIASTSVGRTAVAHPNGYGGDQTIRVHGTHGMISIDANQPHWNSYEKSGNRSLKYGSDAVYDALDHFVDSILNDTEPMCGAQAARDTLEITLAALESARENRVVELPLTSVS